MLRQSAVRLSTPLPDSVAFVWFQVGRVLYSASMDRFGAPTTRAGCKCVLHDQSDDAANQTRSIQAPVLSEARRRQHPSLHAGLPA